MTFAGSPPLDSFSIQAQWLPRDGGDPLERATAAEVGIRLSGRRNFTKIEDTFAQTVRETARLSAYQLASWLAGNWWRLRWEPFANTHGWRMSHHLAAAGGGFVWPDIIFDSDGEAVRIVARPTWGAPHESIVYLTGGEGLVRADDFERTLDRFIETTVARLGATGHDDADLVSLWRELTNERRDTEVGRFRRLEAMLGFDPDEAPETIMAELLAFGQQWGDVATDEVAAAFKVRASLYAQALIGEARQHAVPLKVQGADVLIMSGELRDDGERPWDAGYRLAETVRDHYGLGVGPIATDKLADLFHVSREIFRKPVSSPIGAAFREDSGTSSLEVVLTTRSLRSQRFELMRLVGGHLVTRTEDRLVPATRSTTARQKVQRAFAAEFLCPIAGLREMFDGEPIDEDAVEVAADRYEVPAELVGWMLRNRGQALGL